MTDEPHHDWSGPVIDLGEARRRKRGAERPNRTVFLAFDCPCCGRDVFAEVPAATPGHPGRPWRDYLVTCPNCRQVLEVRDKSGPPANPR